MSRPLKGEDAERVRGLDSDSWAWAEEVHDCHRKMESYLIEYAWSMRMI